jgi:Domain of unknown function (DUF6538)
MRIVGMGLIRNEHGVWCVRKKVPRALEEAAATVTGAAKDRVSWLKKSLRTKDEQRAKVLAPAVLMEFEGILAKAEASLIERPLRSELSEAEIKQITDYFTAHELGADEELRTEGSAGSDALYASIHRQLAEAGIEANPGFPVESRANGSGLSARMMHRASPPWGGCAHEFSSSGDHRETLRAAAT